MPPVERVVAPFFHENLPLIGFNYTTSAALSLHHYEGAWTHALRLCRGIVFDRDGNVIARPFEKFFNWGEVAAPAGTPIEVTVKEDGHLLILFDYDRKMVVTTRGSFQSPTVAIAEPLLKGLREDWVNLVPYDATICAEFIHPETAVRTDYHGLTALIGLAVFDRSGVEFDPLDIGMQWVQKQQISYPALRMIPSTPRGPIEGYVAKWADGTRMKFKYAEVSS